MTKLPQSLPNEPRELSPFAKLVQRKQVLRVEHAAARRRGTLGIRRWIRSKRPTWTPR
jgi:hypothetical protein